MYRLRSVYAVNECIMADSCEVARLVEFTAYSYCYD